MDNTSFSFSYSAAENKEILEIRKKYLPKEESKLEKIKRLDGYVQQAGMVESLSAGIGGAMVFGVGMCCGLDVLAGGMVPAIILAVLGAAAMAIAYPIYRNSKKRATEKYAPEILRLADEITNEKK